MSSDDLGQGEQMIRRARNVAMGLADVGLTQAEEVLRRVSPEGRAQARREREARARRRNRLMARIALAALAALLVGVLVALAAPPGVAFLAAVVTMVLLSILIANRTAPRVRGREALAEATLPDLVAEVVVWLAAQRRGMPGAAMRLSDTLARSLDALSPQLARLDARDPAADAVRTLIATELPGIVESWRAVPISLRDVPQQDGRTPSARLVDGLRLIDAEVVRVTGQLARGALDDVATHGRYLELKYPDDGGI